VQRAVAPVVGQGYQASIRASVLSLPAQLRSETKPMAGKPEMARLLMPRGKAAALLQERIDKPPSVVPARPLTGWRLFLRESEEREGMARPQPPLAAKNVRHE
jgi:hypothetical protein